MRLIGHMEQEAQARAFSDWLYAQGIDNQIEPEAGRWGLWVHEEEELEQSAELLAEFRKTPDDPKYARAARVAQQKREQERKQNEKAQRRYFDRGKLFPDRFYGVGTLTASLIGISLLITLITGFGQNELFPRFFAIARFVSDGMSVQWHPGLVEVSHGELWRLVTPIFIHLSFIHILFNMLWLKDLGSMIEHQLGRGMLVFLVVLVAIPSNVAQFYMGGGPMFGGMSGVVYGLLGYIGLRGKFDPASGLYLDRVTMILMAIWYFVCLMGIFPGIANTVHTVGLLIGLVAGYLSAMLATAR